MATIDSGNNELFVQVIYISSLVSQQYGTYKGANMATVAISCPEKRKRTLSVRLTEIGAAATQEEEEQNIKLKKEEGGAEDDFIAMGGIFDDEAGLENIVLEVISQIRAQNRAITDVKLGY